MRTRTYNRHIIAKQYVNKLRKFIQVGSAQEISTLVLRGSSFTACNRRPPAFTFIVMEFITIKILAIYIPVRTCLNNTGPSLG